MSPRHSEVKFLIDNDLKAKLEEVRSLRGPKGHSLTMAELVYEIAKLSSERLQEKRFEKKRVAADHAVAADHTKEALRPTSELTPDAGSESARRTRYIPQAVKHIAWKRAGGQCVKCGDRSVARN